mmetsp:Transcript_4518/g.14935  ORF Transcript_4518/g.14935 Transcript_4518/m.14935 type:complete len:352 (+) Transcript_4518:153-1208(+)
MPSSLLPLELSVPFLVPTGVAPIARVCRALRAAALNNATWIEVFARRYPCLAELPGFDKPADARDLVKSLVSKEEYDYASKGYDGYTLPPVQRDAQGRVRPLRCDTFLVVQVLPRANWPAAQKPILKFVASFEKLLDNMRDDIGGNWMFDFESEPIYQTDAFTQIVDALNLPHTIEARINEEDTTPPAEELIDEFLRSFDENFQHEIFVVHGDSIHRIDTPGGTCREHDELPSAMYHDDFMMANLHPEQAESPWFPILAEFNEGEVMLSRFWLGSYDCETWDATHEGSQSYSLSIYHQPFFEILCTWDGLMHDRKDELDADRGEHSWHWFCQYLASSRLVKFPRASGHSAP